MGVRRIARASRCQRDRHGWALHWRAQGSAFDGSPAVRELLVDELRDILHAERQLLKALPKMAKAARSVQLQGLFQKHLSETEAQVERLEPRR